MGLSENALDVNLHGGLRDIKLFRDYLVCLAICQASENFDFPVREIKIAQLRGADCGAAELAGEPGN